MKHSFICTIILSLVFSLAPITTTAVTLKRVSVHDPSIVWAPSTKYYYIFGSHRAVARSNNLMSWTEVKRGKEVNGQGNIELKGVAWKTATSNSVVSTEAFITPQVTTVPKNGQDVAFPAFNAFEWSNSSNSNYDIRGNMWAPDVIYNPTMEKWCMYLSINGDTWLSSIILLTADAIEGPYQYQGPVIISGFINTNIDFHKTDLELVLGSQNSLPSRYNRGSNWGNRCPHAIDPCVFYDENGQLWMSYGSWSGGIWILKLNADNGLRDYDEQYPSTNGTTDGVTSDPYFGKKIAGGFYASGEGSYIEHIGQYYFLFVSNGGLAAGGNASDYNNGGYQMRVFRSTAPDGPYRDASNRSAVLTAYELNFGPNCYTRGVNIFGAYTDWGNQAVGDFGERSQGHNSIIDAGDGRTYLVYHTRFQNRGEGHEVRVHQVFQNKNGWLCAAPFEYTGETMTNDDIATRQLVQTSHLPATYHLLVHRYGLDHRKKETVTPVDIVLKYDGTIEGAYTGTWQVEPGTSYITIKLGTTTYYGVAIQQKLEPQDDTAICFTATANNGVTIWGQQVAGTATGIDRMENGEKIIENATYDLLGRRIINSEAGSRNSQLKKGVYIKNGRKVVIK